MFSIRRDIIYWNRLAKSRQWVISMHYYNSYVYNRIFNYQYSSNSNEKTIEEKCWNNEMLLKHLELLRIDLEELSIFLDLINCAAERLKLLVVELKRLDNWYLRTVVESDGSNQNIHTPSRKNSIQFGTRSSFLKEHNATHDMDSKDSIEWCNQVHKIAQQYLYQSLDHLQSTITEYVPHLWYKLVRQESVIASTGRLFVPISNDEDEGPITPNPDIVAPTITDNDQSKKRELQQLQELWTRVATFVDVVVALEQYNNYPLKFSRRQLRTPSHWERFWLRNVILSGLSIYSIHCLTVMWYDGRLQSMLSDWANWLQSKIHTRIVEPVADLTKEVFESISKREYVVTLEELEESRRVLNRMLDEFSQSNRGYEIIPPDIKKRVSEGLFRSTPDGAGAANRSNTYSSAWKAASEAALKMFDSGKQSITESIKNKMGDVNIPKSADVVPPVEARPVLSSSSQLPKVNIDANTFTPEQAMDALMSEYEKEVQTPVRGIVYGSLMTAILIQMQKLKVNTEAAMLTMDQILTSNELTMAATAALPAFVVLGGIIYYAQVLVRPKNWSSPGSGTLHFRLIMSDVDRSLQQVAEVSSKRKANPFMDSNGQAVGWGFSNAMASNTPDLNEDDDVSATSVTDTRQLHLAKGTLRFNLVRLRSEFHSLFELNPASIASYRSKEKTRQFNIIPKSVTSKPSLFSPYSLVAHKLEQFWMNSKRYVFIRIFGTDPSGSADSAADPSNVNSSHLDDVKTELATEMISVIQSDITTPSAAATIFDTLYSMIFGSNELMTTTTQFSSLNRDIQLLEAPEFEVSIARKMSTAARMRSSYKCLTPIS